MEASKSVGSSIIVYSKNELSLKEKLVKSSTCMEKENQKLSPEMRKAFGSVSSLINRFSQNWLEFSTATAGYLYSIHYQNKAIQDYNNEIMEIFNDSKELTDMQLEEAKAYFEDTIQIIKKLKKEVQSLSEKRSNLENVHLVETKSLMKEFWKSLSKVVENQKEIAEKCEKRIEIADKYDGTKEKVVGGVGAVLGGIFAVATGGLGGILIGVAYGAASGVCIAKGVKENESSKRIKEEADSTLAIYQTQSRELERIQQEWQKFYDELFRWQSCFWFRLLMFWRFFKRICLIRTKL